ncbi:MAG TPA: protein kinase [Vicinamibacteria bacterium]|nr:protein kinase [Vicinamibacteria bacterium]
MAIASRTRLGAYEVLEPIGAGGMGEVYKAKDTRIDRTVAIKVLPSRLADDAGLKQRFEREAKSISSLNHPHICTLYEFDSHDGTDFLVMEHLEGESLAERIVRKGAIPFDTALRYATQIADALEGAHRHGVVHRDLKPGNIFLTETGAKLLDFGLAKLADPQGGAAAEALSAIPTQAQALTEQGAILGTFQYMAPEQLEGKEADARTDVFAFGAVVYEMVTGKKAFEGKSQASLIGAILEREPEAMSRLQPLAPLALERVVKKCLAKAPEARYHTMHDLADELRWIGEATPSDETAEKPGGVGVRLKLAATFLLGVLVAGVAFFGLSPRSSRPRVARFAAVLPDQLAARQYTVIAIAPDGSRFAYVANGSIHVRELDQLEARSLPGTEGSPRELAFSPDGEWIAYYDDGQLMKVNVSGGAPLRLSEMEQPNGLSWAEDDVLRFGGTGGVWQVPGSGGAPELVLSTSQGPWRPQLLPDGRTYVFLLTPTGGSIMVQSPEDDAPRVLFEGAAGDVRYLPKGHLVFTVPNDIFAVSFDAERLSLVGSPVPVIQGSDWQLDVSRSGTLLYLPSAGATGRRLVWVDRSGTVSPATDEKQPFRRPHLSADGLRVLVEVATNTGPPDIWVYDLERSTRTRVTTGAGGDPVWAPNGETIVFRRNEGGDLYSKAADGSGEAELLLTSDTPKDPHSFSPDGKRLAYYERTGHRDIWVLDLDENEAEPFVVTEFNERSPKFSPDGRFIAYTSDASGQDEIYVQPYPGPGRRTVVSTEGGFDPVWSRDGQELFYRNGNRMMAAKIATAPRFTASMPQTLFEGAFLTDIPASGSRTYDVSPDGQRFLMVEGGEERSEVHIVLNWLEELEARVPGAR